MAKRCVDFIIIGAMRSGTTSLYYDLAQHPEISMSRKKETDYFLGDAQTSNYQSQFNPSKPIWGEASPNYTKYDIFSNIPDRIFAHSPNVKLIYIVRDPCDRVVSQYRHALAMGNLSAGQPLTRDSQQLRHMIETSKYYAQLLRFRTYFPPSSIMIINMKDYIHKRQVTLDHLAKFIGASSFDWGKNTGPDNSSFALMRYPRIMTKLRKNNVVQLMYTALPYGWQSRAKALVSHKSYCIDDGNTLVMCRDGLLSELREDIIAFGEDYSVDVNNWLQGADHV